MSDTLPLVSGVQGRALEALATYRFMTIDLMKLCGVGRDAKHLRQALDALDRKGWIGRTAPKDAEPGLGRLPQLHWLRPAGAAAMVDLFRLKQAPKAVTTAPTMRLELPHRLAIVETHIRLRQWATAAGIPVARVRTEHGPGRSRDLKETSLPYLDASGKPETYTPDLLAELVPADGEARPLVVEVYRGGWRNTLDHFRAKLPELRTVCDAEAVEEHCRTARGARFLVLFMDDDMRAKALHGWPDSGAEVWERFFVKSLPEVAEDFAGGWSQPGRADVRRPLF